MYGLGPKEIIILAFVLVLLFGTKKIPELVRGVGDAVRHVKNGFSDEKKETTDKKSHNHCLTALLPPTDGLPLIVVDYY